MLVLCAGGGCLSLSSHIGCGDCGPAALAVLRAQELSLVPAHRALQQNSAEMKQRKLLHGLWFQLIKKSKAARAGILLFVSSLFPLALSFTNCNLKSAFRYKIDLRINVLKNDFIFFFPGVIHFIFGCFVCCQEHEK